MLYYVWCPDHLYGARGWGADVVCNGNQVVFFVVPTTCGAKFLDVHHLCFGQMSLPSLPAHSLHSQWTEQR